MDKFIRVIGLVMITIMYVPMVLALINDTPDSGESNSALIGGVVCFALLIVFSYVVDEVESLD